ncbi:MAG: helical backbone metal receptor [Pseudomonadales bacterium]|nr:helical backbone metal receptor [Pseudomonadales bacterium]
MLRAVAFCVVLYSSLCGAEIKVIDDTGNAVTLAGPAKRIVSLAPHLTELLFSLNVGSRVVGTVRFSDYPEAAKSIPVLGDAFAISLESIVSSEPELVVAWHTGGANNIIERLRTLGIPVYVNEALDLKSIARSIKSLAVLVGKAEYGETLALKFEDEISRLQEVYVSTNKKVFFQISDQSLFTINDSHLIGQAISVCGVQNIFGDSPIPVPIVSKEVVLAADPEIIMISQPIDSERSPWIEKWSEIGGYADRIRLIDPALISRPSLRMSKGIKELCSLVWAQS